MLEETGPLPVLVPAPSLTIANWCRLSTLKDWVAQLKRFISLWSQYWWNGFKQVWKEAKIHFFTSLEAFMVSHSVRPSQRTVENVATRKKYILCHLTLKLNYSHQLLGWIIATGFPQEQLLMVKVLMSCKLLKMGWVMHIANRSSKWAWNYTTGFFWHLKPKLQI